MARTIGAILERTQTLGGIALDIVDNQKTSFAQQLTKHPIESGAIITDHVVIDPVVLSFRAEIGNISLVDTASTIIRAQAAYDKLKNLYETQALIDYQTGFELFENMIFTDLQIVEELNKSGALIIDVVLEQILIVESEQVDIPKSQLGSIKTQEQLSSEINRGQQQAKKVEDVPSVLF